MTQLHVLNVFTDDRGTHGNPLGVFLKGGDVPVTERQRVAADLGFSETVFLDDATTGQLQIFTPAAELPFAGHPLVGTSWLLAHEGSPVDVLRPPAGEVPTWIDDDGRHWIRGRAEWAPDMALRHYASVAEVDAISSSPEDLPFAMCWAWTDEGLGVVRARVFAPGVGIVEDEATGAAAVVLTTSLDRAIEIVQGRGSRLSARPGPEGTAEVAGRTTMAEVRNYAV